MSKFIQENRTILLLALLIIVVVLLLVFRKKYEPEIDPYDLSKVKVITIEEAIPLFDDIEPHVYIIGRNGCTLCETLMPAVNETIDKYHITVYYIDIQKEDKSTPQYSIFQYLLNYQYEYSGVKGRISEFLNHTPMIIISSNHDTIYGSIGSMTQEAFEIILKEYGIIR